MIPIVVVILKMHCLGNFLKSAQIPVTILQENVLLIQAAAVVLQNVHLGIVNVPVQLPIIVLAVRGSMTNTALMVAIHRLEDVKAVRVEAAVLHQNVHLVNTNVKGVILTTALVDLGLTMMIVQTQVVTLEQDNATQVTAVAAEAQVVLAIVMTFMSVFFNVKQIVVRKHVLIMVQSLDKVSFMTFIPVGKTIRANIPIVMSAMRNTVHV